MLCTIWAEFVDFGHEEAVETESEDSVEKTSGQMIQIQILIRLQSFCGQHSKV